MNTNAIFCELTQALQLNTAQVKDWFAAIGADIPEAEVDGLIHNTAATALPQPLLAQLLDQWVEIQRGPKPIVGDAQAAPKRLSNNDVLKKLRIAYRLQDEDVRQLLKLVTIELTKSDLSALFRKPGQSQFKTCDDEFVLDYIRGLGLLLRQREQA